LLITSEATAADCDHERGRRDRRYVPKTDSGHADTIGTTVRMRRIRVNAMKPRIQCVLTQWISGFMASGSRPIAMINIS
jgi:hypothetical protein